MKVAMLSLAIAVLAVFLPGTAHAGDQVVAADYPPIMVAGNAQRPGYAIEILQEAARRSGREVDITFMPFARALQLLQADQPILMPAIFRGKRDDAAFQWIVPVHVARMQFSSTSERVDSFRVADGLRIVVERDTSMDAVITRLGLPNVVRVPARDMSARMLAEGRVQGWLSTRSLADHTWRELEFDRPLVFGDVVHEVPIMMVASHALPADVAMAYRAAVNSMVADGTLAIILAKYVDDPS